MFLNKKNSLIIGLAISIFGFVLLSNVSSALTLSEAKAICDKKIDKQACLTLVSKCAQNNSACLITAVKKGASVIESCQSQSDPQACQADYKKACPSGGTTCQTNFAKTLPSGGGSTNSNSSLGGPSANLNSKYLKTDHVCGRGDSAVKTQFDLGCKGNVDSPVIDMIFSFVRFLTFGVGIALTISIVYAGIMYATSGGNPEQTQKAKNRILNAMIGLLFFLLISAFVQFLVPGGLF